jgi:alpha-beta hydrolase superfamily lysophospholipase
MLREFLLLAAVMLGVGIAWGAAAIVFMALTLLRPRRMSDARAILELHRLSPADLGLEFEDIWFSVIDERSGKKLRMAGWWIGNTQAAGKCAIIVHGYSDAKVGGIAWAPLLRSLGFAILAIDLRAHGESEGVYSTAGYWERHDLNQIIDQIKAARPRECEKVLLFGVSLGAAVSAAAALSRDDLWAVVLESPFSTYRSAVTAMADRMGAPGMFFQRRAYRLAQWLAGCDFAAGQPIDTIPKIPFPLMVIQSGDDPLVSAEDRAELRRAVESRPAQQGQGVYWELPNVHHVVGLRVDPEAYRQRLEMFLSVLFQSSLEAPKKAEYS